MATPRSQRIGIWIIAIVLTIGTLGSFLVMVLSNQNQATDQAKLQKANNEYQAKVAVYDKQVAEQTKQLSDKYYSQFNQYSSLPTKFEAKDVKQLTKNDLSIGDGAEVKSGTEYSAYYIGWNPKGVVFDQSIEKGALKAPIAGGNLIKGWNDGVIGMKIGGVRELTIPSDLAYGKTGSGDNIPPNTPIKFVVMIIPKVAEIPTVSMPKILQDYYQAQQQAAGY